MTGQYVLNEYQQQVCLEYQTTHIEQHIFTQIQTQIVYDHCNQVIFSSDNVTVPNYGLLVPLFWFSFVLVVLGFPKFIDTIRSFNK